MPVSVNIGARQLQQATLSERLQAILARTRRSTRALELEVLETSALEDMVQVSQVIEDVRAGWAWLCAGRLWHRLLVAHLPEAPAGGLLKIDQSFVRDMLDDPDDLAILQGRDWPGHAFRGGDCRRRGNGRAHGTMLLQLGCELAQGYGIARPMPAWAVAARAHGIVFGGFDPFDFGEQVAAAKQSKTILVGWHAAKEPGPSKDLFVNVSTQPVDVARRAADFVIQDAIAGRRPVGVVIFNDNQYAVANAKTQVMTATIQACQGYSGCKVLSIENVLISDAAAAMPGVVRTLLAAHGAAWTYSLAINDVYFDEINFPLALAGRTDIRNVSAGDGSTKALGRIAAGISQQVATVAEPLKMHGYQLADELNRALAGAPPSGFQSTPILVTTALMKATGKRGIESTSGFEAAYSAIWARK
jgi:ribose transport system substrate-binding protein